MAERMDPSDFFDGGWENGVEHGDLVEDIMLGVVHPYDRPDGYTPAHRCTRHQIVSEPFADPADRADRGELAPPPAPVRMPRRTTRRAVPTRRQPPDRKSAARTPVPGAAPSKKGRQAALAAAMGWTPDELKAFRVRMAAAQASIKGVAGKATRRQALANALGVSIALLQRFHEAEARTNGPAKPRSRSTTPVAAAPLRPATGRSSKVTTREDLVRESIRFRSLLTKSGAEARLHETAWLLGISRPEATRILQRSDMARPTGTPKASAGRTVKRPATQLNGPLLQAASPPRPPSKAKPAFCPSCGVRVGASGWCRCS